jgi:hypothetical protein
MAYRRTSFREPPSPRLAEFMRQGWSEPAATPGAPPGPPPQLTAARRAALSARLPGDRLVIPAGQPPIRCGDQHYPFRPDSNYVWLTGDQSPGAVLIMEPAGAEHDAALYLVPHRAGTTTVSGSTPPPASCGQDRAPRWRSSPGYSESSAARGTTSTQS